jgi:hypothetical protein
MEFIYCVYGVSNNCLLHHQVNYTLNKLEKELELQAKLQ